MNIQVSNVQQLYDAVNKVKNKGKKIILDKGRYSLDINLSPTTSGRLELQENMELQGQPEHPEKVIIDASGLKDPSFVSPGGFPPRTGAIRMGRGKNVIEWLTVIGTAAPKALSAIDTDLIGANVTKIRVAHCIVTGGRIGICVRNIGVPSNGRSVIAVIEDNELVENLVSEPNTQQGQGIVIQNANGVSGGIIQATLNGNHVHKNIIGLRVWNFGSKTNKNKISITSHADTFDDNELGIYIIGGATGTGNIITVNENSISFKAHGTSVQNNKGIKPDLVTIPCGIFLSGAFSTNANNESSDNKLVVNFAGCNISGNQPIDIIAYGAYTTDPMVVAERNNIVDVQLQGVSKNATILSSASNVVDPTGSNVVNILKL